MKINEEIFKKAFAGYDKPAYSGRFKRMLKMVCKRVLKKYLKEINKPICIKKIGHDTMRLKDD